MMKTKPGKAATKADLKRANRPQPQRQFSTNGAGDTKRVPMKPKDQFFRRPSEERDKPTGPRRTKLKFKKEIWSRSILRQWFVDKSFMAGQPMLKMEKGGAITTKWQVYLEEATESGCTQLESLSPLRQLSLMVEGKQNDEFIIEFNEEKRVLHITPLDL